MPRELLSSGHKHKDSLPGNNHSSSPSLQNGFGLLPATRRLSKRGSYLLLLLAFILSTIIYTSSHSEHGGYAGELRRRSGFRGKGGQQVVVGGALSEKEQGDVDADLLDLLVKTKEAMEAKTPIGDLAAYADRFIVLQELDSFSSSLLTKYPRLNATALETYQRSLSYHHDKLFATLFPYISRSPASPRSLKTLRSRYTRKEGILIPCGKDQFQFAVHLIATLKHVHRTRLPIQVVYAGNDDLPSDRRAALRAIAPDVETIDVLNYFDESLVGVQGGGWAIKVFAILASTFERVIICDSDAVFMQDPVVLFDDPGFNATGTLYFRDREIFPGDGQVHDWWGRMMKGREPSEMMAGSRWWTDRASREEMESGVVAFDKGRKEVLMGLVFVGYLNTKPIREPVTYKYTYGDKESFWMGFELGKIPYHLGPEYAGIIGQLTHPDKKAHSISSRICSDHLFHLDYKGKPLWWNGSLLQEKRYRNRGFFFASHWAPGTVEWACEFEPWCMVGIREQDVHKLSQEEHSLLTHMIGMAMYWQNQFPELMDLK